MVFVLFVDLFNVPIPNQLIRQYASNCLNQDLRDFRIDRIFTFCLDINFDNFKEVACKVHMIFLCRISFLLTTVKYPSSLISSLEPIFNNSSAGSSGVNTFNLR